MIKSHKDFAIESGHGSTIQIVKLETGLSSDFNLRSLSDSKFPKEKDIEVSFDLGTISNWPIFIDEVIRRSHGNQISISFNESSVLTHYQFANFLSNYSTNSSSCFETIELEKVGHSCRAEFKLVADHASTYESIRNLSICVIHNGENIHSLLRLIGDTESVFKGAGYAIEVLLNGPEIAAISSEFPWVTQINSSTKSRGWITQKKNYFAKYAKFENLLILHNRFSLTPSFRQGYEALAGNFTVVSPRQIGADFELPVCVAQSSPWGYSTSISLEIGDFHPYLYVSGGAFLVKKEILNKFPLNELLYWDEAEDLEWSRRLLANGVVPRVFQNFHLTALSFRHGLLDGFKSSESIEYLIYPSLDQHLGNPFDAKPIRSRKCLERLRKILRFF